MDHLDPSNPDEFKQLLSVNGGQQRATGSDSAWDFGFRASSIDEWRAAGMVSADDPDEEDGINLTGQRVLLTEYAKAANGGVMPAYNWQLTGSCVNGGGQNAAITRIGVECCLLPDPERFITPFTLMAYGQSRFDAYRDNTEGDGSSGAAMAIALGKGTVLPVDFPGLPKAHFCGPAIVYDRDVELKYSAVRNHPQALRDAAQPYRFRYREIRGCDDAEAQLRKGRPLTFAGDWGGLDRPPISGNPGILMARHATTWNHQQSVHGFWYHPTLKRVWLVLNQWYYVDPDGTMQVKYIRVGRGQAISQIITDGNALSMHGPIPRLPDGTELPACSYWISDADMDYQCRTGEVRALYTFKGFGGDVAPRA